MSAAMELVGEIERSGKGADDSLRAWGRANRYAGSKDRAAIGATVYSVFRHRASYAFRMGSDAPRALVLAACHLDRGLSVPDIDTLCDGSGHNPEPLSGEERSALEQGTAGEPPFWVGLNLPQWMAGRFDSRFDPAEGLPAFDARAPLDLRVNGLKAERDTVLSQLNADLHAGTDHPKMSFSPSPISPWGLRLAPPGDEGPHGKLPDIRPLAPFRDGLVEIQDEGSQLAACLSGAAPGALVVDLCAGAGGKTLALGAMMKDQGRLLACDTAERRLARAKERIDRAGLTCVETLSLRAWEPERGRGQDSAADPDLEDLFRRADLVFVDAPCSGSGTWRRRPEARWQLTPDALAALQKTQAGILARAARLVRPGGRLVYVTCSLFEDENSAVTGPFTAAATDFQSVAAETLWRGAGLPPLDRAGAVPSGPEDTSLLLAPHISGTDGFFFAAWRRLP